MTPSILLAPPDAGPRAEDVRCVFDEDPNAPDAAFAPVLAQPTESPAQPLAFSILDLGEQRAWWGGPTNDVFVIAELDNP